MSKLDEFYNALIKDPDLEIRSGQTREQAALAEAQYRARQYDNNAKALAMATQPPDSSLESLLNFVSKEYLGVSDEGIRNFHRNMPEVFGPEVKEKKVVRKPAEYKKPDYGFEYDEDRTDKLGAIGEIVEVQPPTPEHPEQKEAKKSKVKESTEYTGNPVHHKTGNQKGTKKTKATGKPEITPKLRNFINYIYTNRAKKGISSAETDELINSTFNNPNWFEDKRAVEQITTRSSAIEDQQNKTRKQDVEVRQKYYIQGETREAPARPRTIEDRLLAGESPSRAEQNNDPHIERYTEIKESLGNNNKKSAEAVWEKDGSIEQARFNSLPNELKPVLSNLHSTASDANRLTPAQQVVLLNLVESESSDLHVTGIHDNMKNPITGDWNMSNDPGANAAAQLRHDELLEQNKNFREEDFYGIISDAMNQMMRNSDSLELSQNQLNHLDDRLSGDNLLTDVRAGQKDLAPLDGSVSDIPDSNYPYKKEVTVETKKIGPKAKKWLDTAKKSLFPGKSKVSNELLASKLQRMANEGLFRSDNPIYEGVTGAKSKEAQVGKDTTDVKMQNASAVKALFEQKHQAFSKHIATNLDQKRKEEREIAAGNKAYRDSLNNPDDTKKQKKAIKAKEKVDELSQTANKTQVNKDNEEALENENIEVINDAEHTENLSNEADKIGSAYTGPAFGEGIPEEEGAGDTPSRLETLPHDMDHSGDTSGLTETNQEKKDLLDKVHFKWSNITGETTRDSTSWKSFVSPDAKRDISTNSILEKFYGQDFKSDVLPEGASVRTKLPTTNSELNEFSLEEIGTIAESLSKHNEGLRAEYDFEGADPVDKASADMWGEARHQDTLKQISSENFKNAVSLDNLDRADAEKQAQQRQELIDAGQQELTEEPKAETPKEEPKEETPVEEPKEETPATDETPTDEPAAEQTKAEKLGLVKEGQYYYEDDGEGYPDKMSSPVHRVEINGEERFLTSLEDMDGSKEWFEYTEENKGSYPKDKKGAMVSGGNTRLSKKELVNWLQEKADLEVEDETSEGGEDTEVTGEDTEVTGDDTEGDTDTEDDEEIEDDDDIEDDEEIEDDDDIEDDEEIEDDADTEIAGDEQRINDFMDTHDETIEHMYTDKYGDDNEIISYDRFKEKLRDKWNKSDSGFDQAEEDVALGHKEMKAAQKKEEEIKAEKKQKEEEIKAEEEENKAKEAKAKKEQKKQEEAEAKKQQKEEDDKQAEKDEKERIKDLEREKKEKEDSENEIAYGDTDEAIAAREEAHASSGSNLYTHFDEKTGELKHETHGEATEKTGEHNHLDDHDEKEAGSHPAHHHNKEIADKSLPPAARDLREQRALGDDADESIIAESTEFLRQQAQEGYIWNANTGHWAHKENLSNLMMKNRGLNATLANGNHVGENGKSTFKDGSGKPAKGIFHLGSGYNLHQLNQGVGGKSLSRAYGQSGVLAAHIKSGNSSSQIGNAGEAYEQSGQGAPASGFGSGLAGAKAAFQVGRTQKPSQTGIGPTAGPQASALSSIRSFFGLEKAILSDSALQKLVDSYQSKK